MENMPSLTLNQSLALLGILSIIAGFLHSRWWRVPPKDVISQDSLAAILKQEGRKGYED